MRYITTVEIPTEAGMIVAMEITRDSVRDTYTIEFSGELLDQRPEALTASLQKALLEIRGWRRAQAVP